MMSPYRTPITNPSLRRMSKYEMGWVAGLLEGEGCFTQRKNGTGTKIYPAIDVQSGDRDVIEKLIAYTGLGNIGGPYKTRSPKHTPMFGWKMSSASARLIMTTLIPHMCERRKTRIEEVLKNSEA